VYLLDTNICVAVINRNLKTLAKFDLKYSECQVSTIAIAELYKGVYCSQKFEYNLTRLTQFISRISVIDFDINAAVEFGMIQRELREIGRPTGDLDAAIAAVARSRQDILVTDNTRHFINIPNLQWENWLEDLS
jgi:tRNA(fMet)-specific endonuclease VapC